MKENLRGGKKPLRRQRRLWFFILREVIASFSVNFVLHNCYILYSFLFLVILLFTIFSRHLTLLKWPLYHIILRTFSSPTNSKNAFRYVYFGLCFFPFLFNPFSLTLLVFFKDIPRFPVIFFSLAPLNFLYFS